MTRNDNKLADGLRYVDLFAGIGGFSWALAKGLGATCVFASEWDKFAQLTYSENFPDHPLHGDITTIDEHDVPAHDILTAGFPCQPFSIAGVSKANALGRAHGFSHPTQGTLFFNVEKIIEAKKPKAFVLENVKNLRSHDGGNTFKVIMKTLDDLGYKTSSKVIDARHWVPQHRERIFIVGFRDRGAALHFTWPEAPEGQRAMNEILEEKPDAKYTLTDPLWRYLQAYAEKHRAAGNGFGFGLVDPNGVSRTLSARYYKDGSEILVRQPRKNPRRLTPGECAKLMGFPDELVMKRSDTRAYRQFGNSVAVPVVEDVCRQVVRAIRAHEENAAEVDETPPIAEMLSPAARASQLVA